MSERKTYRVDLRWYAGQYLFSDEAWIEARSEKEAIETAFMFCPDARKARDDGTFAETQCVEVATIPDGATVKNTATPVA